MTEPILPSPPPSPPPRRPVSEAPRAKYRVRRPARTASTGSGDGFGPWIRSWSKITWLFAIALLLGVVFAFIAVVVDPTIAGRWAEGLAGRLAPFFGSGG